MSSLKTSPRNSLTAIDWKKISKGAAIALIGALLTYGTEELPNVDLGQWTPVVMATWSILVNAFQKYLIESKYIET